MPLSMSTHRQVEAHALYSPVVATCFLLALITKTPVIINGRLANIILELRLMQPIKNRNSIIRLKQTNPRKVRSREGVF